MSNIKGSVLTVNLLSILSFLPAHCMDETMLTVVNQLTQQVAGLTKQVDVLTTNLTNHVKFTNELFPIGSIMEYSGTSVVPNNWLECDGRSVSRIDYPELLGVIGVTYGFGDALHTFNIPDRRGRVAVGIGSDNSTGGLVTNVTAPTIALGKIFGTEQHVLAFEEIPKHHHEDGDKIVWIAKGDSYALPLGNTNAVKALGENTPHNNVQPSMFTKFYIRAK